MQVILYARVSHDEQLEESASICGQLKQMRKYAKERDWKIYREFTDVGLSGRTDRRPGFQELIRIVQEPLTEPIIAVLVWSLSRFSRNYQDSRLYRAVLKRYEIEVVSVMESFEEPKSILLDAIAEICCHDISMYTKMAMRERILQGYSCGGIAPFGYQRVTNTDTKKACLALDPQYAPIVRQMYELYLEGHSIKEIAEIFQEQNIRHPKDRKWNYSKIYRILKSEVYTGNFIWGKGEQQIRIPEAHQPVISKEMFEEVQKIMQRQ